MPPSEPAGPDCVGPIPIPGQLTRMLHALAIAAAVDDFVPLWICATELVRRWSRDQWPVCAQVIRGPREAIVVPRAGLVDQAASFRAALRRAGQGLAGPVQDAGPADVAILVSQDGDRLYTERMTSPADGPDPEAWADAFLRLLSALADRPDWPLAAVSHDLAAVTRPAAAAR